MSSSNNFVPPAFPTATPRRSSMTQDDEAKFALLEPDGVSPERRRRMREQLAGSSQRKGMIVMIFGFIGLLYLAYPRQAVVAAAAYAPSAAVKPTSSSSSSKEDANRGDLGDTVVVSKAALSTAEIMKSSSSSDDSDDTVVVGNKKNSANKASSADPDVIIAPTVAVSTSKANLQRAAAANPTETKNEIGVTLQGDVVVTRHVAGGDDNFDPPPPPPPAAFSRFFSWLGHRRHRKTGGSIGRMIAKLQKEISDGKPFATGELGQRLAEIEQLERAEVAGAQKRKDEAAKRVLEDQVKEAAKARHDEVSEKIAIVEGLMSRHGPRHTDVMPKLKELERLLAHPDLAHPNQESRLEQVRGMQDKIKAMTDAASLPVLEKAGEIEQELKAAEEDDEVREAEAALARARLKHKVALRRARYQHPYGTPRQRAADVAEVADDDEEEIVVVRRPKKGGSNRLRGVGGVGAEVTWGGR